ncbi:MAG: GIY-YIG nuclease family protein, partial [Microgenomates group bacterium]
YCVYVLYSLKDKKFYIGYTTNLHERLTSHILGNSKATNPRRLFILLFCEYFLSKKDALRREKYFKTSFGKKALKLMLKESLKEYKKQWSKDNIKTKSLWQVIWIFILKKEKGNYQKN